MAHMWWCMDPQAKDCLLKLSTLNLPYVVKARLSIDTASCSNKMIGCSSQASLAIVSTTVFQTSSCFNKQVIWRLAKTSVSRAKVMEFYLKRVAKYWTMSPSTWWPAQKDPGIFSSCQQASWSSIHSILSRAIEQLGVKPTASNTCFQTLLKDWHHLCILVQVAVRSTNSITTRFIQIQGQGLELRNWSPGPSAVILFRTSPTTRSETRSAT